MVDTTTSAVEVPPASSRSERVGWYFYDWANSAFSTTVVTVFLGPYLTAIAKTAAGCAGDDPCTGRTIDVLGFAIYPGSLFPYTVSLSVFLTVFVLPVVGAIADRSPHKKQLLASFAYLGAAATAGMLFLTGERYLLGAGLFLLANIAFGASVVVYNSFLPQLAGPEERDGVSSRGWAFGYLGGGTLLALNVVAVAFKDRLGLSTGDVARYSIVSAGLWWALFTTLPLRRLRNRPPAAGPARGSVLTDGFRQLWHTLRGLKAYPLTLFFLVAYLVYNDGIQTVIALASVYGTEELKLPDEVLVPTILMVQFLAFFGAMGLGALAKRIGAWKTVLISLVLWTVVLIAAYLLPAGRAVPFVLLGGAIGIVLGGSQALSRSLFSQLIPKGKEGEYFGLYEISDKGTSWLGPLLFGLAYGATQSYRVAIISLITFFVVGFVALLAVPVRRAIIAAGNTPPRVL
ncbi:MFS transporter, UMF1 family [Micromonospora pattaloongensis]|uniref:MFS transporter, UMF1 family n=1 Tax=Micromonospora pattaloongensis TaxID=405436 RepID=A0A1H3P3Y8_9ACTN|nr:MFS transporter [Micromonospora pattaloongensis]SDY95693.1 MFS transporter, UMF1 family [Micromonospora pattaloongensis]